MVRQVRAWGRRGRRVLARPPQNPTVVVLAVLTVLIGLGASRTQLVPLTALIPVVLLGASLLRLERMLLLVGVALLALALVTHGRWGTARPVQLSLIVTLVLTFGFALAFARSRGRLGLAGFLGEAMLVELRERLLDQSALEATPQGWSVEGLRRPAHGDAFSGDVLLSTLAPDGRTLEICLVDVSGKGQDAGVRGLLLAGSFGGLLGAVAPGSFLTAANRYVLRQRWTEGFATAVHLSVDLDRGDVVVSTAGHPPPVRLVSGRPSVLELPGAGPALGLLPDPPFPVTRLHLDPGDALLVYSDGVVEHRDADLEEGIRRLAVELGRQPDPRDGTFLARLVDDFAPGESDDRTACLVRRQEPRPV